MANRLKGKRVVLTQAADFIGPVTVEAFQEEGAEVIADTRSQSRLLLRGRVAEAEHRAPALRALHRTGVHALQ